MSELAQQLAAADRAFANRQFEMAMTLYEQALTEAGNPDPAEDFDPARAYARLRLGLSALLANREERARQVLQEDFRDAATGNFRQMAFMLWDTYAMTGDVSTACARVTEFARERGVSVRYGQTTIQADEICRVPGS